MRVEYKPDYMFIKIMNKVYTQKQNLGLEKQNALKATKLDLNLYNINYKRVFQLLLLL